MIDAPRENLFRGLNRPPETRDGDASPGGTPTVTDAVMSGYFSVFDTWYEIDSWYEGRFLERTVKGAMAKTIRENRDQMKVQLDHGYDVFVGDALLGPIDELREDDFGPYFEVPLIDTDYNRDRVLPQLQGRLMSGETRGSLLGSSFRFRVVRDEWNNEPGVSDYNPDGIPERTIREVRVFEFGPVVWPANPDAYAEANSARSLTDHFLARDMQRRGTASRAAADLAQFLPHADLGSPAVPAVTPPVGAPDGSRGGLLVASARTQLLGMRRAS